MHRALRSLVEELEAVDGYDHWIGVAQDADLKTVLARCRDQVKEHAAMLLEWMRCRDPMLDAALSAHLFKRGTGVARIAQKAPSCGGSVLDAFTEPSDAPLFDGAEDELGFAIAPRR